MPLVPRRKEMKEWEGYRGGGGDQEKETTYPSRKDPDPVLLPASLPRRWSHMKWERVFWLETTQHE